MKNYNEYKEAITNDIRDCLKDLGCQPILFLGSGISKRYISGPSWSELLASATDANPLIKEEFPYFLQLFDNDFASIGEELVPYFHKWAWGEGKEMFPKEYFTADTKKDIYLKLYTANMLKKITPESTDDIKQENIQKEIKLLKNIRPNSIITTNFDTLAEKIFPEYTPIIGQTIIKAQNTMIGEIFKIHGCVDHPKEIVLTKKDYSDWTEKKKYLSAKLLTFFLEHPILILGYSAQDENVISILRDIDEILASQGEMVPNIYYVIFDENTTEKSTPSSETVLDLKNGKSMRVKCIYAKDFSWIYEAFAASEGIENINPKLLRALVARTYELVRHDIPKMTMEVNYQTLEQAVQDEKELPKLLGITGISDPEMFNAAYPYTLTGVSKKLGHTTWHNADKLIKRIKEEKSVDIKSSDNQFHIAVKSGTNCHIHKYSDSLVDLLKKVASGAPYTVALKKKKKV